MLCLSLVLIVLDPELVADLVAAPVFTRILITRMPLDDDFPAR